MHHARNCYFPLISLKSWSWLTRLCQSVSQPSTGTAGFKKKRGYRGDGGSSVFFFPHLSFFLFLSWWYVPRLTLHTELPGCLVAGKEIIGFCSISVRILCRGWFIHSRYLSLLSLATVDISIFILWSCGYLTRLRIVRASVYKFLKEFHWTKSAVSICKI